MPPRLTRDDGTKPFPVTVRRNQGPPASTGFGESEAMVGTARTSKGEAAEYRLPSGSATWRMAGATVVSRFAGITTVSLPELTNVGVRVAGRPGASHSTTLAGVKPIPVRVTVTGALPASADAGLTDASTGA